MLKSIKLTYYDLKDEIGRFNHLYAIVRNMPGSAGFRLRGRLLTKYFLECGAGLIVHEGVRFRGGHKIKAGCNVEVGVDNFLQASGGLTLGDNVMLGPGVKVWTINHVFEDFSRPVREQGYDYQSVSIGDDVWLGANVFVMPGVTIPEGCIVSAGSVVGKKKYAPFSILSGNPCRVIGKRKMQEEVDSATRQN